MSWSFYDANGKMLQGVLAVSISSTELATDAVTNAKVANDAIDTAEVVDNAITLAKMAHGTDGNLITYDTNGAPAYVATGDDGQVLTSAGANNPPAFETLAAGVGLGMVIALGG